MKRSQYGFGIVESVILVAVIIVVGLVGWATVSQTTQQTQNNPQPQQTPAPPASDSVTIKLIDKTTDRPIANKAVLFRSDNGIRCATEPCETNHKEMPSKTDSNGEFAISKSYFQQENYVEGVEDFLPVRVRVESGQTQITAQMSPGQ